MKNFKNENLLDRLIRAVIAEISLMMAIFWLSGALQIVFYALGAISLFTAITGFCALYKLIGVNTLISHPRSLSKKITYLFVVILIILPTIGGYYSSFFTKKFFLEDYNRMNNYYKQTLFFTGQDKRAESIDNYEKLVIEYKKFDDKYSSYKPFVLRNDVKLNDNIKEVASRVSVAKDKIYNGDLKALHKELEEIRPIFQDILKRNNFSMLAVALVDFHDAMEKAIGAADAKNALGVIDVYDEIDGKLKTVEEIANDDEIKAIRNNLNSLLELARNNKTEELSKKAGEMKSGFLKVYLKRG